MKKILTIIPLVLVLCFTFGCQKGEEVAEEPVVDVSADIQAIRDLNVEWEAAFNAQDIDRLMQLYTDNVIAVGPNMPPEVGKKSMRDNIQQQPQLANLEYKGEVVDVQVSGDLAFAHGTWMQILTAEEGGESKKLNGYWVDIYKKQPDGSWKIFFNMSSNESLIDPNLTETE